MKTQKELIDQMRNTIDFEMDGCVQNAAILNLKERSEELKELRRLAEIGRATENAFKQDYPEFNFGIEDDGGNYVIGSVEELLEWEKEQANENTSR